MTADTAGTAGTAQTTPPRRRRGGGVVLTLVSGFGQLLITAGVVILLFVGYELWFTGVYTHGQQDHLANALTKAWSAAPHTPTTTRPHNKQPVYDKVPVGDALAILYIPRLGRHYHYVVVEGTDRDSLKKGPGHYEGTAMPGQVGNLVISGHRTTYLAPFNRIDELRAGDHVIFETADTWYVYQVSDITAYSVHYQEIVAPDDVGETLPVPNQEGATATQAIFTFTTCNPKYSARQRLIVHGRLVKALPRSQGAPSEIDEWK